MCHHRLVLSVAAAQIYGLFSSLEYLLRSCVVEQLVFYAQQHPRGNCVCFESRRFFSSLLNFTSWLLLTVTPLCQKSSSQYDCVLTGSYFHSASRAKAGWGKDLHIDAHSWLLAHPLVCFCREPDRLIQRFLVLNNDMQLLRMSMSFPVFVRSYLVLLWKPNVILNHTPPPHPPPPFLPVASLTLEKKLSVRESQASSPTLAAAARLAAMIHGKDRMYSNNLKVDQVSFLLSRQWI